MKSVVKWAAVVLALVSLGTAAFFGWKIYQTERDYKEGVEAYDLIAEIATGTKKPGEIPASPVPEHSTVQNADEGNPDVESALKDQGENVTDIWPESTENQASEEEKPEEWENTPELPEIDFRALQAVNPQIVGWIYSPDTVINYPVVKGDDNEYYLHHLADGTWNSSGCPFMDVNNRTDLYDDNTVIYAHHMQNGTMFAGITWYADQSYYDAHPVMYLITKESIYRIEPFSGYTTTMDSSAYMLTFVTRHEYADWLREISAKSDFRTSMKLSTSDHIITLSTCAYSFQDARYVLHGKAIEIE